MKKLYFLSAMLVSAFSFGQSVVITTIVDGTLPGDGCSGTGGSSSPKIVELYVNGTVNFTNYRFQTESNGAADASAISWSGNLDLTPLGSVTNSFVYLVYYQSPQTSPVTFQEMYPSIVLPTGLTAGNLPNGNGNDAYRIAIYDAPTAGNLVSVVDQFGNPLDIPGGSSDYSAAWAYQDSYAKRNNGVGPNAGNFVSSSFTYGGNAAFASPNNTCTFISSAISLGSYQLGVAQNDIAGLSIYPNPVTGGNLFITSASNETKSVAIFDVLGKLVVNTTTDNSVNVSHLKGGVYVVKITEAGKTATRKLVIK